MIWAGHVARMREISTYQILDGKPEKKRPRWKTGRRLEDIIRMDRGEIEWEGVDWNHLAQDRDQWPILMYTIMNFWVL